MGLLTEKYKAWAKHPEKYSTKQVLDQIVADLNWLDEEQVKLLDLHNVSNSASANKCTCGKCTGLPDLESYYED